MSMLHRPLEPLAHDEVAIIDGTPDDTGVSMCASAARAAADRLGASGETAALAVHLLGSDAVRRLSGAHAKSLRTTIRVDGTELVVTVADTGEPVQGALSATLSLAEIGVLTGVDGGPVRGGNARVVRLALPAHRSVFDEAELPPADDTTQLLDGPVEMRPLEAGDAGSLVRCLFRCYGWSYPNGDMYFPGRVAAMVESGKRIGEVAVDTDGEVVAHWGAKFVTDGVVETGVALTDPRYRRRGIANAIGDRLLARLPALGVTGRLREPVLTHSATQLIALREGAHVAGVFLHAVTPMHQVGITDGTVSSRTSISVMYSPLTPLDPATIWVPREFEPIVRHVLGPTDWQRTLGETRGNVDVPDATVSSSSFEHDIGVGLVDVEAIGADLVDVVDGILVDLQRAGAKVIRVSLPVADRAVATVGSGLAALGLSFAALIPRFGQRGDVLVLQWLADPVTDESTWQFASDHVRETARLIVEQTAAVIDAAHTARRRQARRQRLFAALPSSGA